MISHDELLRILHYDQETGHLTWKVSRPPRGKIGARAGNRNKVLGYRYVSINGRPVLEHQIIWFYMTGEWPDADKQIDHINRIRDDNRWSNLRLVTQELNKSNSSVRSHSGSGIKGVHYDRRRKTNPYRAQISINKKTYYLGNYATEEEAQLAYDREVQKRFGSDIRRAA